MVGTRGADSISGSGQAFMARAPPPCGLWSCGLWPVALWPVALWPMALWPMALWPVASGPMASGPVASNGPPPPPCRPAGRARPNSLGHQRCTSLAVHSKCPRAQPRPDTLAIPRPRPANARSLFSYPPAIGFAADCDSSALGLVFPRGSCASPSRRKSRALRCTRRPTMASSWSTALLAA